MSRKPRKSFVGHPDAILFRVRIRQLKVKVRASGIPRIADQRQHLSANNMIANVRSNAVWLEMSIEGELMSADVQDDIVATHVRKRHLRIRLRPVFRQAVKHTVLPAYSYVNDTLKVFGIPQNWILDSQGMVRLKGTGYDSTEKWEAGMAEAIERVKAESGAGR